MIARDVRALAAALLAAISAAILALPSTAAPAKTKIAVLAASSLTEAFADIARDFERAHPGIEVELNFGGSRMLRVQVENGAPADLFASADPGEIDSLRARGLCAEPKPFARNRLVLVTPAKGPRVTQISDLSLAGVKLVLAERSVPAGHYAEEALDRLAAVRGAAFVEAVRANVVSRETNVRAALAKVVLGEADAAIVYRTDALAAAGKVRTIEIPEAADVVAEYEMAVVARGHAEAARALEDAVLSPEGREALRRHGFE